MLASISWNVATLSVVLTFAVPIVAIIAVAWYKTAKTTSDNELKRTMVERGMTADDIERVLAAKSDPRPGLGVSRSPTY